MIPRPSPYSAPEGTAVADVLSRRGRHVSTAPPTYRQIRLDYLAQHHRAAYERERSVPRHRAEVAR